MTDATQYFLDSSFLVALMDAHDVHHKRAQSLYQQIDTPSSQMFLSDVVMNEVLSVFAKRCESKGRMNEFVSLAGQFKKVFKGMPILCLYHLLPEQYAAIISLMGRSQGMLNFHDCLIVLFLKEVKKVKLVTFDKDFQAVQGVPLLSG